MSALTKPLALVVEDDLRSRMLLVDLLQVHDFEVADFENAEDTLAHLRQIQPDIMLFDLALPGMNGRELLQKIRRERRVRTDVACIALTANGSVTLAQELHEAGFAAYHPKPIRVEELVRLIRDLCRGVGDATGPTDFGGR